MQGACEKKPPSFASHQERNVADIFVFDIFDRFSFEEGRQYALDVFQSRGEPAL